MNIITHIFIGITILNIVIYFLLYLKSKKIPYFLLGITGVDVFLLLGVFSRDGFGGLFSYDILNPLGYALLGQGAFMLVAGFQFCLMEIRKE